MQRSAWLFLFISAFAGGVAFRSFFDFGPTFSIFILFLGAALTIYYSLIRTNKRIMGGPYLITAVFFLAAGLGMLRFDAVQLSNDDALDARVGGTVQLSGVIIGEPDIRETHAKLIFQAQNFSETFSRAQAPAGPPPSAALRSKILLTAEHYPEFRYGDEVLVRGMLQKPRNFTSSEGNSFDYVSYLAKDDIAYQMFYPKITLVAAGRGNPVKAFLLSVKQKLVSNISRVIPEPYASLWAGITLGAKQSLGPELLDAFRVAGVIHIVVLSGYNITIVAETVGRIFMLVPRVVGLSAASLTIVAFALMTGAGATVVRASAMALLVLLARATGRVSDISLALFFAGFLMILWNPKTLAFDPSFQLSFLATLGLIQLAPKIERFFGWLPTRAGLREAATATIATQLFVLPLLISMMGTVSVVAPLSNMLILPFIPVTMLFGFLASIAGFLHEALALPFAYIAYALLAYELWVVDVFASLPFASVAVPAAAFLPFAALCVGIFLVIALRRRLIY